MATSSIKGGEKYRKKGKILRSEARFESKKKLQNSGLREVAGFWDQEGGGLSGKAKVVKRTDKWVKHKILREAENEDAEGYGTTIGASKRP